MQSRKPLSFLGKKEEHLMHLAEELLCNNNRKSFLERNSIGPRKSKVFKVDSYK